MVGGADCLAVGAGSSRRSMLFKLIYSVWACAVSPESDIEMLMISRTRTRTRSGDGEKDAGYKVGRRGCVSKIRDE